MLKFINKFINKNKKVLLFGSLCLLAVLLVFALITKKRVAINHAYYTKEDVALYLITYHELPCNYYYRAPSDKRTYEADIYGGFIHKYDEGLLPASLKDSYFKECDVYTDSYSISNRGIERLVYTTNTSHVRVFYTNDHYESYTELTEFNINKVSHIFSIAFWCILVLVLIGAILVLWNNKNISFIKNRINKKKDKVIDVTINKE